MNALRVYKPHQCDQHGVPLNWEQCQTCGGFGNFPTGQCGDPYDPDNDTPTVDPCPDCRGYGSLKDAALAIKGVYDAHRPNDPPIFRCEGCGHRMSDGVWEDAACVHWVRGERALLAALVKRDFPVRNEMGIHWSLCGADCRHDRGHPDQEEWEKGVERQKAFSSGRLRAVDRSGKLWNPNWTFVQGCNGEIQASWRQVDIRTLSWPHDLRPEQLAILCTRCYAERLNEAIL